MAEKNSNEPLILETERFLLRSLETKDATDTYISWWNDKEIQEGLGARPRNWGQIEAERHINKFDNQRRYHLGIFPKGEDVPIGFFTIFEALIIAKGIDINIAVRVPKVAIFTVSIKASCTLIG